MVDNLPSQMNIQYPVTGYNKLAHMILGCMEEDGVGGGGREIFVLEGKKEIQIERNRETEREKDGQDRERNERG